MGIYDREYYRGETGGSGWFSGVSPVCKSIIVINVAVFLLRAAHPPRPPVHRHVSSRHRPMTPSATFELWELLTATFFHADIWHLAREHVVLLDRRPRDGVALRQPRLPGLLPVRGDLQHAGLGLDRCRVGPDSTMPMIGASGAVMAVVMLFTLFYPKREILLFFIPMPMWVLLAIYLVFPLFPSCNGGTTRRRRRVAPGRGRLCIPVQAVRPAVVAVDLGACLPAEAPHLLAGPREQTRTRSPNPSRTLGERGQRPASPRSVSVLPEEQLDARLDEVLAKIAREGRSGLTEEELRVLQEASRRARIRRSDRL